MKEKKKLLILIFVLIVSLFLFSCSNVKKKDKIIDSEFKVEFFNNNLVSGDNEMYEFYSLTKEGKPLSITITYTFEKDYYNEKYSASEQAVDKDVVHEYELVYDGNMYNYYDVTNSESLGSYEYLNYSKYENRSVDLNYIYRVGYVIARDPNYTYETYLHGMVSSFISYGEILSQITPIVMFTYYSEIGFKNNKITNISYYDGEYKYYYSDYSILTTAVLLLNKLSWTKDLKSLSSDYNFQASSKKICITMNRTLVNDEKGLMVKISGDNYLLHYIIDLDYGIISMDYANLFSTVNNLYAKLTDEQIESIKGIIKEDLIKDFTLGEYSFRSNDESTDWSSTIYRVKLGQNNKAEIAKDKYYENGDIFVPIEDIVASGTYYIESVDNEKELVISDNDYNYRFRLSYNENKSIMFVSNESNPNCELFTGVTDESIFYYGENYLYGNTQANQDKILINKFRAYDDVISDAMTSFLKTRKSSYGGDTLLRVRTNYLRYVVDFYKFEKSCETFMEFDGKIYEMGPYEGGYGVTQLAYYHEGDKYFLYYILSYGSDTHQSEVYSFDFKERVIKKVEGINIPEMIDIEFCDETTSNDKFVLSIYESKLSFERFPVFYDGEKQQLLIANILDKNNSQ